MKANANIQNSFLLSSGRSGSTLLSNILNAHKKILSVPESTFLIVLSKMYGRKNHFTENDYKNIVERIWLRKEEFSKIWNINNGELLQSLLDKKPQKLEEIIHEIYFSYNGARAKKSPAIIVDKNPLYFRFIKSIQKNYPKAKYILLVRDYRDRMASLRKSKFSNQLANNLIKGIAWNKRNRQLFKMSTRDNTILIKYEDLVTNPEKTITNICNFIGVSFEPQMLNFHQKETHDYEKIETSEEMNLYIQDMHKRSSNPISTDRIGVWKNQLSKNTVSTLETFCGKTGELFGYEQTLNNTFFKNIQNRTALIPSITKGVILLFLKKKSFSLPYPIQKMVVKLLKRK